MAASTKPSSRYSSFESRSSTSSHFSDPSSSAEFTSSALAPSATSRALAKTKPSDLSRAKPPNLTTAMKNLMARNKSGGSSNKEMRLVIPIDTIAQDLKKTAKKPGLGLGLGGLPKKLFGTDKKKKEKEVKALTDVKVNSNARTLAMVLRSERELLSNNKEMEMEIAELKLMLDQKNKEVEKLKDLCLNQREEIKALKDAILFPDVTNNQLQGQLEKQGSELKQAKQIIPALQKQVTSLTGQLQCLADDLAEVKADRYSEKRGLRHHGSSPRTLMYDQEEADNSLEFSSEDATAPGSPDDLFLKDLNPCLTPHQNKTKSKEFLAMEYDFPSEIDRYDSNNRSSHARRMSRSSEPYMNSNVGSTIAQRGRRSDDSKRTYGKPTYNRLFE